MAIKDLQARQGDVNLTLEIIDKGEVREFEKFGRKGRVCTARAKDDSGEISLTLWNEDIDKVNKGDIVKVENGWVREWQGELQLSHPTILDFNKLNERYQLGVNLIKSTLLYCFIALFVMILFNVIASKVLSSTF